MNKILTPYEKETLKLKNHLVMAPMTRSRAIDNLPNNLMVEYYAQRSGAGLIITEGTSPTLNGLGYPRIPGIFSQAQIDGWKAVTEAVHAQNSKIFIQLMHTGRIGHIDNLPEGAELVGASDLKAGGQIHTDKSGMQDHSAPKAMTTAGVKEIIAAHVTAAKNAITAGFDGIELHGANGYLIEQFLNPNINNRTDEYGGSIAGRTKMVIEMARDIATAIGKDKVGIRFSPYNKLGDLAAYPENEIHETYAHLAAELNKIGIVYIHIGRTPDAQPKTFEAIRAAFTGTIILCNGFTPETAEAELNKGAADLIAFGRPFLANPDFDKRIATNAPLAQPDFTLLFTPGAKGYTDYPALI